MGNVLSSGMRSAIARSNQQPARPGLILSFDALGTLYRFRAPVANQYLTIAQRCGLKSKVELPELDASFRRSFKAINVEFPNYGKGRLDDPEVWWTELVKRSFKDVVKGEDLPQNLGSVMYQHFSSGAAYELYPDVKPFLERMHEIRRDPDNPTLMLGIITNSDPRVKNILESFNLKIGLTKKPNYLDREAHERGAMEDVEESRRTGVLTIHAPWEKFWNSANDFDFLTTSYEANCEKPQEGIFNHARSLASELAHSRATQKAVQGKSGTAHMMAVTMTRRGDDMKKLTWIHVGDDYEKDYNLNAYFPHKPIMPQTLHLVREGEGEPVEGADTVTSLTEVASIVNFAIEDLG